MLLFFWLKKEYTGEWISKLKNGKIFVLALLSRGKLVAGSLWSANWRNLALEFNWNTIKFIYKLGKQWTSWIYNWKLCRYDIYHWFLGRCPLYKFMLDFMWKGFANLSFRYIFCWQFTILLKNCRSENVYLRNSTCQKNNLWLFIASLFCYNWNFS